MLKKEGANFLNKYRNGEIEVQRISKQEPTAPENDSEQPRLFRNMPKEYNTNYFKFFRLAFVAFLAYLTSTLFEPIVEIHPYVLCLLFGVFARSIGFLERNVLQKANGFGFAIMALLLFILDGLNNATPGMMLEILYPLIGCIVLGVIGMYIFSFIMGKILKVSKEMAFAVSLTAFYGFPADYIITVEVIDGLTKDETEREALISHMLPPMLVAGFVTVTIVSVILAGIFVGFL
jgi:hypothetical protein